MAGNGEGGGSGGSGGRPLGTANVMRAGGFCFRTQSQGSAFST